MHSYELILAPNTVHLWSALAVANGTQGAPSAHEAASCTWAWRNTMREACDTLSPVLDELPRDVVQVVPVADTDRLQLPLRSIKDLVHPPHKQNQQAGYTKRRERASPRSILTWIIEHCSGFIYNLRVWQSRRGFIPSRRRKLMSDNQMNPTGSTLFAFTFLLPGSHLAYGQGFAGRWRCRTCSRLESPVRPCCAPSCS